MDSFITFGNNKSALKRKVKDYKKRSFIVSLLRYAHTKNLNYVNDLSDSFVDLHELKEHRKEKVYVSSSAVYFYFEEGSLLRATLQERLRKSLYDELARVAHYKFAEVTAANVSERIAFKLKDPRESDRDDFFSHHVLANTGALLELNCKFSIHIVSPEVRDEYFLTAKSNSANPKWSYFVCFYFGTSAVHLPPIPTKNEKSNSAAEAAYKIVENQLLNYIGAHSSLDYSLVFDKFRYLFLRDYNDYKIKYIDSVVAKEGFFDSIGGFFSKAVSVVSNVAGTAMSVASTAMDVYQNTIKPIAKTLAPVLSPMLPGAVGTALNFVASENSLFLTEEDRNKEASQFLKKAFQSDIKENTSEYKIKVPTRQAVFKNVGTIRVVMDGAPREYYTGAIINKNYILSEVPEVLKGNPRYNFTLANKDDMSQDKWVTIEPEGSYNQRFYYFRIKDEANHIKNYQSLFELDFRKSHSSDFAFSDFLLNRDIFMASFIHNDSERAIRVQASKILKFDETDFLEAFIKESGVGGSPVFYINSQTGKYKVIGTCSSNSKNDHLFSYIEAKPENSNSPTIEKIKSKFLLNAAYKAQYEPAKAGKKESGMEDSKEVKAELKAVRNDPNKDYQSLRTILKRGTIAKQSNLKNIGIFELDAPGGVSYGVGIFIDGMMLLTLKKYVVVKAQGKVYERKFKEGSNAFEFNLEDRDNFNEYQITDIGFNDSEDFAFISYKKKVDPSIKEVRNNYINEKALRNTEIVGGFFLEFNFSFDQRRSSKVFTAKWSEVNSIEMEKQLINSAGITDSIQRLYFAYEKHHEDDYNAEFIFGISNPSNDVKVNYFYEEVISGRLKSGEEKENMIIATEKIIFGDNRKIVTD